jgi:diguanylate cyclase
MISLKKYLDTPQSGPQPVPEPAVAEEKDVTPALVSAYGSALLEMGSCSMDACPSLGDELKQKLCKLQESLATDLNEDALLAGERLVQEQLQNWGRRVARHSRQKAHEVKEMLIVMARAAESVGERDKRCVGQFDEVTARLETIRSLDDLTAIRASIEKSAEDLKSSVARMAEEGKAAIKELQVEVSNYQARLEEAEHLASCDALTGLRSRFWVESQIEHRIERKLPMCVAIVDIDGFKKVNDVHGHLTGDELLKQFAKEIKAACRSTDIIGRWGGDEFIILLDCKYPEAKAQIDRLRAWVCGDYKVNGKTGPKKFSVHASIGLAEHMPAESMKYLISRADAAMYEHKAASRPHGNRTPR